MRSWTKLCALISVVSACGGGAGGGGGGGDGGGAGVDGSGWTGNDGAIVIIDGGIVVGGDGGTWTCYQAICSGKLLECGDCVDNDGDGEIDAHDRECLGPCDNTEGPALSAGIGGETGGPCKADCYFDFGNGSGNDDCTWDHQCDPLAVAPAYPPEGADCQYDPGLVGSRDCPATQSTQCLDFCPPITPNGCDCFGCCTFPALAGGYVWIGALGDDGEGTCTFDAILDPASCPPCTPVAGCLNDCARCELCLGKPELPPDCITPPPPTDGGVIPPVDGGTVEGRCPAGVQVCGLPGEPECAPGTYCITGCCQYVVP